MHRSARQFPHSAHRGDTTPARASARTESPPALLSEDVAPAGDAAAGATTRGDVLGAILARAVAERAHGDSGMTPQIATLQRVLGIGKKKKPARPTQVLPAPSRPKQTLPKPNRPTQALPKPNRPTQTLPPGAAASPGKWAPDVVPQTQLLEPDEIELVPVETYLEWLLSNILENVGGRPVQLSQELDAPLSDHLGDPRLLVEDVGWAIDKVVRGFCIHVDVEDARHWVDREELAGLFFTDAPVRDLVDPVSEWIAGVLAERARRKSAAADRRAWEGSQRAAAM